MQWLYIVVFSFGSGCYMHIWNRVTFILNKQMFNIDFNDVWLLILRIFLQLLWKPVQINTFIEITFYTRKENGNRERVIRRSAMDAMTKTHTYFYTNGQ